jgi:glycosyltransferase involved in cell wall biosynthesis
MRQINVNPTITVAIPVFNGEKYIGKAIESVLNQSFSDFRLIICDNRSTDGTQDVCLSFKDSRIEYHQNERNLGIAGNHNRAFEKNTSPYFKWLSHDDLIAPTYLEKCVALLQQNPDLAIAHSKTLVIDQNDKVTANYDRYIYLNSFEASDRLRRLLWMDFVPEIHGLMRSEFLKKTRLYRGFAGADRNLVAHMILLGEVAYVEEHLFSYRVHSENYSNGNKSDLDCLLSFDPQVKWAKLKAKATGLSKWREYLYSITHSQLSASEQASCYLYLMEWFLGRTYEETLDRRKDSYYGKYRLKIMQQYEQLI